MVDTVGNSLSAASVISLSPTRRTFAESIEPGDQDYYRFTLSTRSSFDLSLTGLSADIDVQLLRNNGTVLLDSLNDGTLVESINTILDPGVYYIRVFPDPAVTPFTSNYNLNVQAIGSNRTDIVWRDFSTGNNLIWQLENFNVVGTPALASVPATTWRISAAIDFNNDSRTDLIWRDQATGQNQVWILGGANGITVTQIINLPTVADTNWQIRGAADFDGNGSVDLVYRNQATGGAQIWLLNGAGVASIVDFGTVPGSYQIQAVGDFTGDNRPDLFWRNQSGGGDTVVWALGGANGTTVTSLFFPPVERNLSKQVQGTGDFDGDGKNDLFWRNFATGENEVWVLDGVVRTSVQAIPRVANLSFQATTPFRRTVTPTAIDYNGNSLATAFNIGALNGDGSYRGTVGGSDPVDYYRFFLGSQTEVDLRLTGPTGGALSGDLEVEIYNSLGGLVASSNTSPGDGTIPEELLGLLLDQGTYYVRVVPITGSSDYVLSFTANNLPVLATNAPLLVSEGGAQTLSNAFLRVTDENNPPIEITYSLATTPVNGGNLLSSGGALIAGSLFTQDDIDRGRITFEHDGSETLQDTFVFSVTDGQGGTLPDTTYTIDIIPVNDQPILLSNNPLDVSEGSVAVISNLTTTLLLATDVEQGAPQLRYSILSLPTNGSLLRNGLALTAGASFTQQEVNEGRVSYQHNGSETASDSFTFNLTDGAGGVAAPSPNSFSINVLPFNDPPVLTTRLGLTLSQGSSATIDESFLTATDAEAAVQDDITYSLVAAPTRGTLFLNSTPIDLVAPTFTQGDIDNNRISYTHDGTSTNSDRFTFIVTDGANVIPLAGQFTFDIAVLGSSAPPILTSNVTLQATEGAESIITNAFLSVTDADSPPSQSIFTVGSLPVNGQLKLSGVTLAEGGTFTQQSINQSLLRYEHNGSETLNDTFTFTVSDGQGTGTISTRTFSIVVQPVNDPPTLVSSLGLTVTEGTITAIRNSLLLASDVDNLPSAVSFRLTGTPTNGSIVRSGTTLGIGDFFTQSDLNSPTGLVRYQHDGSETLEDSFSFEVTDGDLATVAVPGTFTFVVEPFNDLPISLSNNPITLDEGGTFTLSNTELLVTDVDGPNGSPSYSLSSAGSAPLNGILTRDGVSLGVGGSFTQADIDAGLIVYTHNGGETLSDRFIYVATDGAANLPARTFSITVNPVNDAPVLTVPTSVITIQEDETFTFASTGPNRVTVTDVDAPATSLLEARLESGIGAGTLRLGSTSGITILGGANGSSSLTIEGTLSSIRAALNNLRYQGAANYSGEDTVTITVDDRGAFGNGGPQQDTEIITLNILPVNDRPTLTTPGPVTTDEDLLTAITGISTTDVDSGSSPVLASITANNGTLTLGSVAGIEFADGTSNGSSVLVFTGLISDIDLALASLQYQGNPDYFNSPTGTPSATPDVITIRINDQGATGPVPQETSGTIAVTVRAVNDAPSFDGGPNQALLEDAPAQTVTGWATNISRGPSNESSQGLSFTVTTSNDALFATRPAINTTTGNLTYTLLPNAFGSATVTVRLRDTGGTNFGGVDTSDEYTFLIDVTGVNDVPVFTRTVGSISVNEDAPLQTTAVINGVRPGPITPAVASEAGQNLTFNVESSNPSLFLTLPEINIAGNNGLLTFQPAENANGSAILTITLSEDGGTDNGGVDTSAPQLLTIFVNAQNDAPILTTPVATLAAVEDTLFNITEISLTDVDAGSSPLQVTLRATSGRLDLTTTEGLTNITGRNSSNLSFRGSQTSLNQALNGLSYIGNLNFNGLDQITVTVNDQGNTGAGGQRTSVGTVTIDVAAVNDPPTLTVSSTARNVDEDRTLTLTGITVSDVDAGANSVELSLTADNGTLRFINPAGGTTITGDNTSNVVIRGSTTAINTSLARLVYQGNLDYNGPDAVNLTINDLGEFGSGGPGTAQGSLSINVRPVNDRPVITVPSAQTIVEDGEIQFTGATAVTITDVDAGVAPIRVTFTVTRGTVNFGSTEGLTVAGVGTRTATLTGPQAAIAAALETFSYRPDANYFGSDTLTISANDQGNTGGAAQTDTRTVSIFVQSENDVPVLVSNNGLLVSEGAPAQTIRNGALRTTDADNPPANTLVYSLVQATSPGTLRNGATVLATGSTFTQADIDNNLISYLQGGSESTGDSFVFTVIDGQGGVIGDTTFNITVNPINDRPTLVVNSPLTVLENNTNGSGDVITNTFLRVTDPDNTDAELRYTLRGLPSSGSIRLSGSTVPLNGTFTQADINSGRVRYRHDGSETTTDSFLFEVSDGAGGTISSTPFRIQITPQNDSPVVVSTGPITLNEGAAATIRNTALRTTDPDNLDSSIRYTLLSTPAFGTLSLGATVLAINSTFTQEQINNGQLSYSHDGSEEQPPGSEFGSDFFSFSVTDGTVTLPTRIFNIRVRPVNDAPEAVLNDGLVIDGTVPSITEINSSQLFVTDRDNAPSEIRYTLRSIPNAAVGTLRLGGETGTALGVGSSFTQDDLNNNRLVFEYLGGGTVTESFQFSVSDGSTTLSDDFFYISFN